jgi:hypothetical protein
MTITWTITQTDYLVADGFITSAHWTAAAVDGAYSASVYNTCSFATATPSIPYASVTEQEVLSWCWSNGVEKDLVETSLAKKIALLKNPVTAAGVPWGNSLLC